MGNLDLVFIINGRAFLVRGTEYDNRDEALQIAIKWFNNVIDNQIIEIKQADQKELVEDKDIMIGKMNFSRDIEKIEIYNL